MGDAQQSEAQSPSAIRHSTSAIELSRVSHRYPKTDRPALEDVSFTVAPGEVFGVLGPNGGGKTTLFRLLSTMLLPGFGAGQARVFGYNLVTEPGRVREQLGVVFQHPSLDGKLTAEENLTHGGKLYGLSGAALRERIAEGLERFGLTDRRKDYVDNFSGGMRRRLELAKALLHEPRLLLMDEPSTGLDPAARRDLWSHLASVRDRLGVTVVLTTHLMDEAERCDRLAVLSGGRLVAVDTPAALKGRVGGEVVVVSLDERVEPVEMRDRLGAMVRGEVTMTTMGLRFETTDGDAATRRVREVFGGRVRSVTVGQPTLEDAFFLLTGRAFEAEG